MPDDPARLPVHGAGAIQPGAWLLAFAPDWSISHVSANCDDLLGCAAGSLPGRAAHGVIGGEALHDIRSRAQLLGSGGAGERLFGLDLSGGGAKVDATLHVAGRGWLLTCEPAAPARRDHTGTVLRMAAALRGAGSQAELCAAAARDVRALTGFDRVQVLRFAEGGHAVLGESAGAGAAGFAQLMFATAADKALYAREWPRLIGDRDAPAVPVLAASAAPLDLAASGLAAPTEGELAALAALGARALVALPLRRGGEAWGAIACCHGEARTLPFAVRPTLEVLANTLGLLIELMTGPAGHEVSGAAEDILVTPLAGRVLVVEDNMLIAMEAEEIVQELGASECDVAGSVATALRLMEAHTFDFALLDIELGHETSETVAHALAARGIRFVYASGYGGPDALAPGFPAAPVVTKPYGAPELARAIRELP